MPRSETTGDSDSVRLRYRDLTETFNGVTFVGGESVGPVARHVAYRLVAALGPECQITGPWSPPATVPAPPIDSSPPPAPAVVASEPEASTLRAPTRRLRRTP